MGELYKDWPFQCNSKVFFLHSRVFPTQAPVSTAFVSSGFLLPPTGLGEPSDDPAQDVTEPGLDEDLISGKELDEVYLC